MVISCVFSWFWRWAGRALIQRPISLQAPESSNCDRTWLWRIRSLVFFFLSFFCFFLFVFCFFLFFYFFKNPSVIGPGTPIPRPPQALQKGGEEVCSVCQRRANVSAIMSPPLSPLCPREKGGGRGGVSRLDTQSDSLPCIVADYCVMTNCCPEGCFPVN